MIQNPEEFLEKIKEQKEFKKNCRSLFFWRGGFLLGARTQSHWPIALSLSFKFIGGYSSTSHITEGHDIAQHLLFSFTLDPTWQRSVLIFSNMGIHIEYVRTFLFYIASPAWGSLLSSFLCSTYCRLICPLRSSISILQCFLSSLLMNWTCLLIGPSRHRWLVPYLS